MKTSLPQSATHIYTERYTDRPQDRNGDKSTCECVQQKYTGTFFLRTIIVNMQKFLIKIGRLIRYYTHT